MSLNKPLETVTEADLLELIADQVAESQNVDYKIGLYLDKPGDPRKDPKDEFRADVSSFANASGGHLVIGMDEKDGLPIDLCGMDIANPDAFKMRIDELLQSKISPRIPGCATRVLALENGKSAVVIRIPHSFNKPHQVTFNKDDFQFWSRNSAGKYRLAVDELRSIITQDAALTANIREFRSERIGNLMAGEAPVRLRDGARTILHIIPLNAFGSASRYNVSALAHLDYNSRILVGAPGAKAQMPYHSYRHNLDGFIAMFGSENNGASAYLQVFRNGILEAVEAESINWQPEKPNWNGHDEILLKEAVERGLKLQKYLGVQPPVVVLVTLMGVKGYSMYLGPYAILPFGSTVIDKDILALPDVLVANLEMPALDILLPIFDTIWNAGGFPHCMNYKDGKYVPPQ